MTDTPARAVEARRLLRAARVGTIATSAGGQPFASLITPATAPDGSPLLLLSDLSEHTGHLRADPHCALLLAGAAPDPNPQLIPRVTVTGLAEVVDSPTLKARYLAVHPYAALYADFADFHLWRVRPTGGLWVGGFGRAGRLKAADLAPDPAAVAAIAAAEPELIAQRNAELDGVQANRVDATFPPSSVPSRKGRETKLKAPPPLAGAGWGEGYVGDSAPSEAVPDNALVRAPPDPGGWRVVALDADGCDLAHGERVIRVHWPRPAAGPDDVRCELERLAGASS
jgi:heme iron utilization protein